MGSANTLIIQTQRIINKEIAKGRLVWDSKRLGPVKKGEIK